MRISSSVRRLVVRCHDVNNAQCAMPNAQGLMSTKRNIGHFALSAAFSVYPAFAKA
jgi:hypothetical protein